MRARVRAVALSCAFPIFLCGFLKGAEYGSRSDAIHGIWAYCRIHNLVDATDSSDVKCDEQLMRLFSTVGFPGSVISDSVSSFSLIGRTHLWHSPP